MHMLTLLAVSKIHKCEYIPTYLHLHNCKYIQLTVPLMKAYILVYVLSIAVIFGNHYPDPDYKNCLQNHLGGSAATKP